MTETRPRQHHYIPKVILRSFCNSGLVWVGDSYTKRIFKASPNNVFKMRDLYADYDLNNIEIVGFINETLLSHIESDAGPVIEKIINIVRKNDPPELSSDERGAWQRFYHAMCRRTPESMEEALGSEERFDEAWRYAVLRTSGGMNPTDVNKLSRIPEMSRIKAAMRQNNRARFASADHRLLEADVGRFCNETGLGIAVIRCPKRSFVIGSYGVSNVGSGKAMGSWLPIAHDVAVTATSRPEDDWLLPLDRSKEYIIKRINTAAVQQSRFIAGASEVLIRSLMRR